MDNAFDVGLNQIPTPPLDPLFSTNTAQSNPTPSLATVIPALPISSLPSGKMYYRSPPAVASVGQALAGELDPAVAPKKKRGRKPKNVDGSKDGSTPPPSDAAGSSSRKRRGRPPGTGKKPQPEASGSGSYHVVHDISAPAIDWSPPRRVQVFPGEDVAKKIMRYSMSHAWSVSITLGCGTVSKATFRDSSPNDCTQTYEGMFKLVALSGSFQLIEGIGPYYRSGVVSAVLSCPDQRLITGVLAGPLIAASIVQVILSCCPANAPRMQKIPNHTEPASTSAKSDPHVQPEGSDQGTLSQAQTDMPKSKHSDGSTKSDCKNPCGAQNNLVEPIKHNYENPYGTRADSDELLDYRYPKPFSAQQEPPEIDPPVEPKITVEPVRPAVENRSKDRVGDLDWPDSPCPGLDDFDELDLEGWQ